MSGTGTQYRSLEPGVLLCFGETDHSGSFGIWIDCSSQTTHDCAVAGSSLRHSIKVLKKKAAVAWRLLIDIWKMRTGRTTAQALGLILNPPPRT